MARGENKNGWSKSTKRAGQWLADRETAARVRHDARAARRENRLLAKRREQMGTWRTNAARRNSRENRGRVRVPNGRFDFIKEAEESTSFFDSQTFANLTLRTQNQKGESENKILSQKEHVRILHHWQGQKDSNPQQRFWRPTCYHYTIPLSTYSV